MEKKPEPYHVRLLKTPCASSDGVSRWLCRRMNLPCEKGPEGRYDFESMVETDRRVFSKFNPGAQMPDENAPLAPLRDDVTLIDPCSGQLSAGAQVRLEAKSRTPFIETVYTPSDLWVPAGARDRPQTPPTRPSALIYDSSEHKRWNSRMKPEAALKAKLGGNCNLFVTGLQVWSDCSSVTKGNLTVSDSYIFINVFHLLCHQVGQVQRVLNTPLRTAMK